MNFSDKYGKRRYHGFHDVYGVIYKKEGIRGLYRGFGVSSVGIFIYRGTTTFFQYFS